MKAVSSGGEDTREVGTFLKGWGGVASVLLGIAVALALYPLISELVLLIHSALVDMGMTAEAATMTLYWVGMAAIGVGFFVAFAGSDVRMDRLRGGVGDWMALLEETLIATGVASLFLLAAATWDNFADEFNTYETVIELSAISLMLLIVASGVLVRWLRHRRSSEEERPS